MLLRNIFEALARTGEGKAAVVGWGRGMGHKGHMYLASSVITHANQLGADPYFVVSRTVGKDDPITPEEKLAIYKKVFPEQGHIFQTATDEIPDLTRVLSDLNRQGYTSATIVLGADQVKAFQYLKNYNGKPDKAGNVPYTFDKLDVISRQETKDPSAGEEGPRATPMRQVLMDPTKSEEEQFQVWRDAMNPQVSDDEVRDLMMKAKERMTAMSAPKPKKAKVAEGDSTAMAQAARRLTDPKDGASAKLRAAGDKRREDQLKGRDIANRDRTSKDEWGNLKELSNDTLGRYKKAAAADASAADKAGDYKRADKRFSGIVKATKKQFANDEKKVAEYGDTAKGQKMLGKVQKRAVDRVVSKKAETDPKYAKKNSDTANAAWDRMADKDLDEKWSQKYKSSINCSNPKGFSQKAHCAGKNEELLPKSAFAGTDKHKLGPAAHAKGKQKGPVKKGQFVGGMEEQRLVPISEDVENIMSSLIESILKK